MNYRYLVITYGLVLMIPLATAPRYWTSSSSNSSDTASQSSGTVNDDVSEMEDVDFTNKMAPLKQQSNYVFYKPDKSIEKERVKNSTGSENPEPISFCTSTPYTLFVDQTICSNSGGGKEQDFFCIPRKSSGPNNENITYTKNNTITAENKYMMERLALDQVAKNQPCTLYVKIHSHKNGWRPFSQNGIYIDAPVEYGLYKLSMYVTLQELNFIPEGYCFLELYRTYAYRDPDRKDRELFKTGIYESIVDIRMVSHYATTRADKLEKDDELNELTGCNGVKDDFNDETSIYNKTNLWDYFQDPYEYNTFGKHANKYDIAKKYIKEKGIYFKRSVVFPIWPLLAFGDYKKIRRDCEFVPIFTYIYKSFVLPVRRSLFTFVARKNYNMRMYSGIAGYLAYGHRKSKIVSLKTFKPNVKIEENANVPGIIWYLLRDYTRNESIAVVIFNNAFLKESNPPFQVPYYKMFHENCTTACNRKGLNIQAPGVIENSNGLYVRCCNPSDDEKSGGLISTLLGLPGHASLYLPDNIQNDFPDVSSSVSQIPLRTSSTIQQPGYPPKQSSNKTYSSTGNQGIIRYRWRDGQLHDRPEFETYEYRGR